MITRAVLAAALAMTAALTLSVGSAAATWSTSGAGTAVTASQALPAGATPGVLGFGSFALVTWSATALPDGTRATSYVLQRTNVVDGSAVQVCAPTGTACLETGVPNGTWVYRVQARLGTWIGPWGAPSAPFQVGPAPLAAVAADVPLDPVPLDPVAVVAADVPLDPVPLATDPVPAPVALVVTDPVPAPVAPVAADPLPEPAPVVTDPLPEPAPVVAEPVTPATPDPVPDVLTVPVTDPTVGVAGTVAADPVLAADAVVSSLVAVPANVPGEVTPTPATVAPPVVVDG